MRIVFASTGMGRGGAEIQVKDCAIRLIGRGHDVLVISMLPFDDFEHELRSHGVQTATLGMSQGKPSLRALAELVSVLRAFRPDVVHAHMFAAILASRLARAALEPLRPFGVKPPVVIGTSHASFETKRSRYLAYRLSDPFSDLWTCVCREGVEAHERHHAVPARRGVLTANGIDVREFAPDAATRSAKRGELGHEDAFVWLTVGSFRDEAKDYSNLLRAFARLGPERPAMRLIIAGAGKLLEEKKAVARELGVAERVDFLGIRSDIAALMQAADAFVLGSAREAMPLVLLEAAASGLPIVATDVGQNADLVPTGTGYVVPPRDDAALAGAMRRLFETDADERRRMGERARALVERSYDLGVIVDGWEARYRELAGLPARPHDDDPLGSQSIPSVTRSPGGADARRRAARSAKA